MPQDPNKYPLNGLTQRQENFALEFVRTGDAIAAYKASYKAGGKPATINSECNRLLRKPEIKARILELRDGMRERMEITVAEVMKELWDNSARAKEAGQIPASNQALIAIGNHLGMFERKQAGPEESPIDKLTPQERRELRAALERERDRRAALAAARPVESGEPVGEGASRTLN